MFLILGHRSRLTGSLQVLLQVDKATSKIRADRVRKALPSFTGVGRIYFQMLSLGFKSINLSA